MENWYLVTNQSPVLTVYERVKDDEKLMIGFKLTYSLLHPTDARAIREVNKIQNEESQPKAIPSPATSSQSN